MCNTVQITMIRKYQADEDCFPPLLAPIASGTDRELAKYVQFLKEENKILRNRIPGEVHTRPDERQRLLQFGKALGRAVEELITLVSPSTFYRWCREENGEKKTSKLKGGQRKPRAVRELVIEIAKTTGFGYTRIIGELRKLGIKKIGRQTVRNILKETGIKPGPDRSSDCRAGIQHIRIPLITSDLVLICNHNLDQQDLEFAGTNRTRS